MASVGHPYTLVGFSEGVDRRPLFFVEPLPVTRICSACGLVPRVKAFLPCEHFFCKSCYDQCERSGRVACPLDGDTCSDDEVTWTERPAKSVMTKQVLCWNHTNGCNVITAAAEISKHFHNECGHHMARCPKCSAEIPASDVCTHLESHCDASREPSGAAIPSRHTVSEEQEPLSVTCSDVTKRGRRIPNANSMAVSSVQARLKEISRAFKIAISATPSDDGNMDDRHSRQRLLHESLSTIQNQLSGKSDQLDDCGPNGSVNQQALSYRLMEKIEAVEQAVKQAIKIGIGHREMVEQFAALREAIECVQPELKAELAARLDAIREAMEEGNSEARAELAARLDAIREAMEEGNSEARAELAAQFVSVKEAMGDGHIQTKAEVASQFDAFRDAISNGHSETRGELSAQLAALRETMGDRDRATNSKLESISKAIDSQGDRIRHLLRDIFSHHLSINTEATTHTWTFQKYGSRRQRSITALFGEVETVDPVYLRGYCVSVDVHSSFHHGFLFRLHKGKLDDFLEWPFKFIIKLCILHPENLKKLEYCKATISENNRCFLKPVKSQNDYFPIFESLLDWEDLERNGFVHRGRISFSLELEPMAGAKW
ncbi:uncharacterized protein LOC144142876 isoform X1 [Haemaphysalis longicornis]